jgi:hypothetical protein
MWCHGGVLSHFNWIIARIESANWWAKDERNLWRSLSLIILLPEHPQNDEWSKLLGKHRYCQNSWSKKDVELSIMLLWNFCHSAFCFGVTSHPWMKHVFPLSSCCFEIKRCFFQRVFWQKYFVDQTPTYKIKASQSWRLKVFWLRKWLDAWKWHEVTKQFLNSYFLKLNHTSYS